MIFCDAIASLDRFNCPAFIISTGSAAGALPLGVVITTGESTMTILCALELLKCVLPPCAFFGEGPNKGPQLCITDDQKSEHEALQQAWPDMTLLLCTFHFLQSFWKWLWDRKNGVTCEDRKPIMQQFRKVVYAPTEEDFHSKYDEIMIHDSFKKYPKLLQHLKVLHERRHEWALAYHSEFLMRGKNTNNYAEAGIQILKDIVFQRSKAHNLVQMYQFFSTTLELYYECRLLDVAHGRQSHHLVLPSTLCSRITEEAVIEQVDDSLYIFRYANDPDHCYLVDMNQGHCSYPHGYSGSPCKHQAFCLEKLNLGSVNFVPEFSSQGRQLYAMVALGQGRVADSAFFANIMEESAIQKEKSVSVAKATSLYAHDKENIATPSELESCQMTDEDVHMNEKQIQEMRENLLHIVDDLCGRVEQDADPNLVSGITKFIAKYDSLSKRTVSTPAIATALHTFGYDTGKLLCICECTIQSYRAVVPIHPFLA